MNRGPTLISSSYSPYSRVLGPCWTLLHEIHCNGRMHAWIEVGMAQLSSQLFPPSPGTLGALIACTVWLLHAQIVNIQ